MKYIKSEKLKKNKYLLTLEILDRDLEMIENLIFTYAPFQYYQDNKGVLPLDEEYPELQFTKKYDKWLNKIWRELKKVGTNYGA